MLLQKSFFITLVISLVFQQLVGNNLVISGGNRLAAPDADKISFTVSWQNSWMVGGSPGNHDAVWLFIKYRECGVGGGWSHALLDTVTASHTFASSITMATPIRLEDRLNNLPTGATVSNGLGHNTGVMIRRSTLGVGHISNAACTLKVTNADFDPAKTYDIRVFGIEMVQVINEPFVLGDGASNNSFNLLTISNELASYAAGALFSGSPAVASTYPKGVAQFYCMKYEISQGQYANFLNTSTAITGSPLLWSGVNRNALQTGGVSPNDVFSPHADRAQNFMNWQDLIAYLDWAALRPMTEFEYEKVCKGPMAGAAGSYAWGNTTIIPTQFVSGNEDGTETVSTTNANCHLLNYYSFAGGHGTPVTSLGGFIVMSSAYVIGSHSISSDFWRPINSGWLTYNNSSTTITSTAYPPFSPTHSWSWGCCWYDIYTLPLLTAGSNANRGFGPVGCGIYARDATTTRTQTGAAYYGAMEMSGNVWEQCVSVSSGTVYTGTWGDGKISVTGNADVPDWPGGGAAFTNRALRGGGYDSWHTHCRVSDRSFWNYTSTARDTPVDFSINLQNSWSYTISGSAGAWTSVRRGAYGGRGVR